jgi:hypothetical protein
VYEIISKDSSNTFTTNPALYLNSSSFTIRHLTSSVENGTGLTAFDTLPITLTANHQGPLLDVSSNPFNIPSGSITFYLNNLYSLFNPPTKTISDFTGSTLILTIPGLPLI